MRKHNILSKIFVLLVLLYLYVPIIVLMVLSLNESRYNSLPFEFTTKWYEDMISNESLLLAAKNSLLLALITGIICTVLATLFTLGQRYLSKKVSGTFHSIVMMPMSIPWLIMGLSLLLMITVEIALISGVKPNLIDVCISIGSVVTPLGIRK